MKINAKILNEYIKKVSLNTTIMMINLNFTNEGIKTSINDISNISMVLGNLKKDIFENYEEIGELFIKDSKLFSNIIKTFTGDINLEKIGDHTLKIANDTREAYILLADEKICENIVRKEIPNMETTISMEMSKADLRQIVQDMRLLAINVVYIKKENGELIFQIGKEHEYDFTKNKIKCDEKGSVTVGVGKTLIDYAENVSDNFTINLGTDTPIILEEDSDKYTIKTYIAPIIESE